MRTRSVFVVGLLASLTPALACAQIRASEHGTVSQRVSGTTISLEYDRPVARGRTLFGQGGVVRWGEHWTPGANWATTFEVDRPVHLNGLDVPKGKYSVWMIPGADEWTVTLNREVRRFHTQPPSSSEEQVRFTVKPVTGGAHMETLAFYFPVVTRDGATLDLHWGTTVVPMRITVEPTRPPTIADRERASYLGRFRLTPTGTEGNVPETTLTVTDSAGHLRATAAPALWGYDPTFDLVPTNRDREFRLSFYHGGKLFGMEAEGVLAFRESDGRMNAVDFLAFGRVIARGVREN